MDHWKAFFDACALRTFESMKLNQLICGNEFATDKKSFFLKRESGKKSWKGFLSSRGKNLSSLIIIAVFPTPYQRVTQKLLSERKITRKKS